MGTVRNLRRFFIWRGRGHSMGATGLAISGWAAGSCARSLGRRGMPVEQRGMPVERREMPVEWRGMPVERRGMLVERRGMPVERRGMPVERRGMPVERRGMPVERREMPVERRGMPVERRGMPVERRGMPVERRGMPVERRGMPVERSGGGCPWSGGGCPWSSGGCWGTDYLPNDPCDDYVRRAIYHLPHDGGSDFVYAESSMMCRWCLFIWHVQVDMGALHRPANRLHRTDRGSFSSQATIAKGVGHVGRSER